MRMIGNLYSLYRLANNPPVVASQCMAISAPIYCSCLPWLSSPSVR